MRISVIAGARPNFIKIAPLMAAMREEAPDAIEPVLVHTGQHYDANMSDAFFRDLDLPAPDVHLGVGSGSHAEQTAKIMTAFEKACLDERPGMVLVVGDVNSTMACAIVAAKLGISVAHVEAGLRSFDRSMPEEINRVVTDAIADWLFVSEPSGVENLRREGKDPSRVFFTGNVMIDTLARYRPAAARSPIMGTLGAEPGQYGVVTLHRPSNVDRREVLEPLLGALSDLGKRLPLFFAIHPRTKGRIAEWGLGGCFSDPPASSTVIDPGPRLTREVRAARGATRAHTWQVCNGGATTRCDADRAVRRR
ncbi:MAG: UDP-N-acetyl glucosamine 2-epimerase, partial [Deltaproteobacteria bacterium]|nr:UDP-N-acetyl glucosamine 2-epimerase [Deltaproteobacteria bacterium]